MTQESTYRLAASMVVRDDEGHVLIVQEADPRVQGKFNLPGGHVTLRESVVDCALRELLEETGLTATVVGLVGIYVQTNGINFVFAAHAQGTTATPGDDILSCHWMSPYEIAAIPDEQILRPKKLRRILTDALSGHTYPVELIRKMEPEEWEKLEGNNEPDSPRYSPPTNDMDGEFRRDDTTNS